MTKQTVITDEGLKKLEKELEELKTVKRKEVAEKIKVRCPLATFPKTANT